MRAFYLRNGWPVDCEYIGPARTIALPSKVPRALRGQATKRERRQMARERTRGRRGSRCLWTPGAKRFYVAPPMSPHAWIHTQHQWAHILLSPHGQEFALYLPAGIPLTEVHCRVVAEAISAAPDYSALRAAGFLVEEARNILIGRPEACLRAEMRLAEANDPEDEPAMRVVRDKTERLQWYAPSAAHPS